MILSLLNFQAIVSQSAAAVQAKSTKLLNLTVGSVLRSLLEASASIGLWIQYLIVQIWLGERLATASGTDVDSFVNDFLMTRLPAAPATGFVTFSRASTSTSGLITPYFGLSGAVDTSGVQVQTADGSVSFGVSTDTSNVAWNASLGGYLVGVGISSLDLPVTCLTSGVSGNVQAGTISLIATATPFAADTVTNAAPYENGADQETDDAVRSRFKNYINTRALGTQAAVDYAISTVQPGLTWKNVPNSDAAGNFVPGNFVVVVDDGTGAPPASVLSAVFAAVDAVRPIGSTFTVIPPTVVTVTVSLSITVGTGGIKTVLQGEVENNILDYIDALPVGSGMPYSVLAKLAWDTDPSITNVTAILLNGGTADVPASISQVIKAGTVAIN
jgi:uncharacterized phage protein gp47/JayE